MVPGPWAREAASQYRGEDVGVHLTLNAEFDLYRWGPITHCPSLLDGDGGFPRTLEDLWDHADTDEVRRECRAQIERAIYWGFDVSHLSSHLGGLDFRPEFFDVVLELAVEFRLPLRLPRPPRSSLGFPFRALSAGEGVLSPDHLIRVPAGPAGARRSTSCCPTSARGSPRSCCGRRSTRPSCGPGAGLAGTRRRPRPAHERGLALDALAQRAGVSLIGYRALRDLQRYGSAPPVRPA